MHEALQRAAGRTDPVPTLADQEMIEPGSRYIDFLVPGLLGMSLMGGGMWGVGFVIVDMRIRKLLKRFLATPMRRSDFLLGIMISRLVFMIPEVLVLLVFARVFFGVVMTAASRRARADPRRRLHLRRPRAVVAAAQDARDRSGLMNLIMLPMWLLSGIFFRPIAFRRRCSRSSSCCR